MQFLTRTEATAAVGTIVPESGDAYSAIAPCPGLQIDIEDLPAPRLYRMAERLVDLVDYFDWCVLWVTQTEVWAGSEDLHLYYTVRRSFGERSEVEERPAQRFLRHELPDVVSFVHLGMLNGWDMLLVTSHDYGRVFISHDGWAELVRPNGTSLEATQSEFAKAKFKCRISRPAS